MVFSVMMTTTGKLRIVSKLHSLISVILRCLLETGVSPMENLQNSLFSGHSPVDSNGRSN